MHSVLAGEHEKEAVRRCLRQKCGGEGIRILRHQKTKRNAQPGDGKNRSIQLFMFLTLRL